jgi:hypothetical protein
MTWGLGKTVQAIALLLEQAEKGASLVVAPTSVCHNWESEFARFAPTLAVRRLAAAADRRALVESLGPGSADRKLSRGAVEPVQHHQPRTPWLARALCKPLRWRAAMPRRARHCER